MQDFFRILGRLQWPLFIVAYLSNDSCATTLFNENFLDLICIRAVLTTLLRNVVLIGSLGYKLPMIINIFKRKGADGLNPYSLYLETSAYLALLSYNILKANQFWLYADCIAATTQNIIMILLLFYYGTNKQSVGFVHISTTVFAFGLFQAMILQLPTGYWHLIATYFIIVSMMSRLPQIISNFSSSSKGVQSLFTCLNSSLGAAAKLFVNLNSTKDLYLIVGALVAFVINSTLLLQVLWLSHKEKIAKVSKKEAQSSTAATNNKVKAT